MPELPEIESLKGSLRPQLINKTIKQVRIFPLARALRRPLPRGLAKTLSGRLVEKLARRGKVLLVELSGAQVLLFHLGMSGRLVFHPDYVRQKHDHILFMFEDGVLVFNDPRRFGFVDCVAADRLDDHPSLRVLGPEPLEAAWSAADFVVALAKRKSAIKVALLDQKLVAGVGNIYASEALFDAGIDPNCPANELSAVESKRLQRAVVRQLKRAVAAGGSTIKDYLNGVGAEGKFQHQFRVYNRAGLACLRQGCEGSIVRLVQAGRATFYCPACQKVL